MYSFILCVGHTGNGLIMLINIKMNERKKETERLHIKWRPVSRTLSCCPSAHRSTFTARRGSPESIKDDNYVVIAPHEQRHFPPSNS